MVRIDTEFWLVASRLAGARSRKRRSGKVAYKFIFFGGEMSTKYEDIVVTTCSHTASTTEKSTSSQAD